MNTKEFHDKHFRILLWELEWKGFVAEPRKANAIIVEDFYSQAPEDVVTPFQFWGVPIEITADRYNDYYRCMDCQEDEGIRMRATGTREEV